MSYYITEDEFAEMAHLTKPKVRELCQNSRIPGAFDVVIRGKKHWRIPKDCTVLPSTHPRQKTCEYDGLTPYEKAQRFKSKSLRGNKIY